jgi:hypothetical protein
MIRPEALLSTQDGLPWDRRWAPYDQPTYRAVLDFIFPGDAVLEIGAGDLRLAMQIAGKARQVYALEIQKELFQNALVTGRSLQGNLSIILADARSLPFKSGFSVAVLLMRHCIYFRQIIENLKAIGCERLITNARWRMGVEQIFLPVDRIPYLDVKMGWYACWCGAAGFKPGPVGELTAELDWITAEVSDCPECSARGWIGRQGNHH